MKPTLSTCARLAVVLAVPAWLLAAPAAAQHQPHEAAQPAPQAAPAPAPEPPAQAVPRDNTDSGSAGKRARTGADGTSSAKPAGRSGDSSTGSGTSTSGGDTTSARGRDGKPAIGEAVPRTSPPPSKGGRGTAGVGAYGGYGYGGYGYGGYYGGYYDPYDPERSYPDPAQYRRYEEGALKLKIKPEAATVYIDGYYTGVVDDFDGLFQRMRIEGGPHRIEVRAPGFESLEFNVFIESGRTLTLRGELKKIQ